MKIASLVLLLAALAARLAAQVTETPETIAPGKFLVCMDAISLAFNRDDSGPNTLETMSNRLEAKLQKQEPSQTLEDELDKDYEALDETAEEWDEDEPAEPLSDADRASIQAEMADLDGFGRLAISISHNAKGKAPLKALAIAFKKATEIGAAQKAIIFTESRKTQSYLLRLLADSVFKDGIVLFNDSDWFRKDDDVRWQFGVPPKGNANFAWAQHFIHHLAPQGMAGFVLANGNMSSNQSGEGDIRQKLIEADLVDCMVALPGQLFYSTQIPVHTSLCLAT